MRLAGRRILVTGAASGIGAATVRRFLAEGACIAALDIDGTGLEALRAAGGEALLSLQCDVSHYEEVDAALRKAAGQFGGLDGIVNCAAIDDVRPIAQSNADHWRRIFEINVTAPMMLCRLALELFTGPASIVNVSSAAGLKPLPNRTAYCASKAALIMATKALAMEIAGKEVRANVVCPGVIDTPMLRASFETAVDPDAAYRQILGRNILSRIARPEEVVHGILYLTSDEASFVTGSTLTVDGGRVFH